MKRAPKDPQITQSDLPDELRELNEELRATQKELHAVQRELRKRTAQLLEASLAHGDDTAEKQQLVQRVRKAEARADKVQQTLSFRLGYELIHKSKSLRGLASLPGALWEVNQEAVRRRDGRPLFTFLEKEKVTRSAHDLRDLVFTKSTPRKKNEHGAAAERITRHFELPSELGTMASGAELAQLRVASIMDEFTRASFGPECQNLPLSPEHWEEELEQFEPHLLFIESAWNGQTDEWSGKIGHLSPELRGIVRWCQERAKIPTLFWCKEDPVHFSTFINTAALFDFVFTTDIDCIHRYKQILGHERIYLLPFACQPATQNPIEKYERKEAACFAGAYYVRYPERQRDFLRMVLKLLEHWPVEIFDRNFGKTDLDYQFPKSYRPLIQGTLAFSEIDRAYKGYTYSININSIKNSQSMFARRVFEVLASNSVTVSNFSRGIQLIFGDLVIATDDPNWLETRLAKFADDDVGLRKFRLAGLRKVLREHTYQDRLAYLACKVFEINPPELLPEITVLASPETPEELGRIVQAFDRQTYHRKRLLVIIPKRLGAQAGELTAIDRSEMGSTQLGLLLRETDFAAFFACDDYYGTTYLLDLALSTRYFRGLAIGKVARYEWKQEELLLTGDGAQYRHAKSLAARSAIARPAAFAKLTVYEFAEGAEDLEIETDEGLSIDEFSYCRNGAQHVSSEAMRDVNGELGELDSGLPLLELLREAEQITSLPAVDNSNRQIDAKGLARIFPTGQIKMLTISHGDKGMVIDSVLEHRTSQYVYVEGMRPLRDFGFTDQARFFLDVSSGAAVQAVFIYFDAQQRRLGHTISRSVTNHEVDVPADAAYVRFGLHVSGPGRVIVHRLVLGFLVDQDPVRIFGRSKTLVLTNHYPSTEHLYRNAFVHRRVLKYREHGESVDVFQFSQGQNLSYHDFEGVAVLTGGDETLRRVLATNQYDSVLVHFLNESMWSAVEPYLEQMRVVIWLHGVEIQDWQRRHHDHSNQQALSIARESSERRSVFWRSILGVPSRSLRLVFVSQYLADQVQQDLGLTLPREQLSVIHNLIDGELFSYVPKPTEQRKRILSIRPFTSQQYANDLSVQAIVALSERAYFGELYFLIIGRGPLFEETLKPLRPFPNVRIEERFLTQREMAELYDDYGVFLVPTRGDTQGVSRDEAMACGLVPITNNVTAIPEFVDDDCSLLAPADDAVGLAEAIERLYFDPELFLRLSANAAARVRRQSSAAQTIERELALFGAGATSAGGAYPEKSDDTTS